MEEADGHPVHRRSLASGGRQLTGTTRAYIGLGGNVGDVPATLAGAVRALAALPGAKLRAVSPLYVTAPVGLTDQPDFHNAVVALDVPPGPSPAAGATALLAALKHIERAFGRQARRRWGPRELDLDLLLFGDARLSVNRPPEAASADPAKTWLPLEVPHPEARARLFVLAPLAELDPDLVPPGWDETVAAARDRRRAEEGPEAVREAGRWTGDGWSVLAEGP